MEHSAPHYPSTEIFDAEARRALASIPPHLGTMLRDIVLKIEEFATAEQLAAVGVADKWNLTGLYEGRPINQQSVWESGTMPAVISLFRQPLLREWAATGVGLQALIRHVVIHEAGHHFGFSDADMHALEDAAGN